METGDAECGGGACVCCGWGSPWSRVAALVNWGGGGGGVLKKARVRRSLSLSLSARERRARSMPRKADQRTVFAKTKEKAWPFWRRKERRLWMDKRGPPKGRSAGPGRAGSVWPVGVLHITGPAEVYIRLLSRPSRNNTRSWLFARGEIGRYASMLLERCTLPTPTPALGRLSYTALTVGIYLLFIILLIR